MIGVEVGCVVDEFSSVVSDVGAEVGNAEFDSAGVDGPGAEVDAEFDSADMDWPGAEDGVVEGVALLPAL
jgi:hypothetical protein